MRKTYTLKRNFDQDKVRNIVRVNSYINRNRFYISSLLEENPKLNYAFIDYQNANIY